jgi:hypothetical protein
MRGCVPEADHHLRGFMVRESVPFLGRRGGGVRFLFYAGADHRRLRMMHLSPNLASFCKLCS